MTSTAAAFLASSEICVISFGARLIGRHAGELLELGLRLVEQLLGAPRGRFGGLLAAGDGLFLFLELGFAPLQRARFLRQLLFAAAQRLLGFCSSARRCFELVGGGGLRFERELLGLELRGAFDLGGLGARGVDELCALGLGDGGLLLSEHHHPSDHADDERGEAQDDADDGHEGTSSRCERAGAR